MHTCLMPVPTKGHDNIKEKGRLIFVNSFSSPLKHSFVCWPADLLPWRAAPAAQQGR